MLHYSRYFNLIGLLIPIAIVLTLFMARGKFYQAVNRAAQNSLPTTPTPSM
jgi:Tfp pilus assembly major pilin PilA